MQSSPSGFTLPVVEAWSTTINHFERGGLVEAAFRQELARVRVLADLRYFHRTYGQVLQGRGGCVDDLVRILGSRRNKDDVAWPQREHFASHAKCPIALKDDEHLFLGMVEMVRTPSLARSKYVDRRAELSRCGAFRQACALSVVLRLAQQTSQRDFVEVPDESGGKGGGVIGHGGERGVGLDWHVVATG